MQSRKAGVKNTPAVWAIIVSVALTVIGIIIAAVVFGQIISAVNVCTDLGPGVHDVNGVTVTCG